MEKFANFIASVTSLGKDGAFASIWTGKVETKIFIPFKFAKITLNVGDWVSLDGFEDPTSKQMMAMTCRITTQPVFFGNGTVKFFDLEKGFGYVTMLVDGEGQVDACLPFEVVESAGWFPAKGLVLEITAVKQPRRWEVQTFMLVEKTGADDFIDLGNETVAQAA